MSRNIKITIEYDGTDYHGWQIQPGLPTIQGILTKALSKIDGQPVAVHGSGRTDAGVHARGQVASFLFQHLHSCETLLRAINGNLPPDIRVMKVEEVDESFHARFSARRKTYHYQIFTGKVLSPFLYRYVHHCTYKLDLGEMRKAIGALVGTHDFTSFTTTFTEEIDAVRTIYRLELIEEDEMLRVEITADGFLRYMVRNIVGTLIEVGRGSMGADQIERIIDGRDRTLAGPSIPAKGLTLISVDY